MDLKEINSELMKNDIKILINKKSEPLVILVCPNRELKSVKLNDIEVEDVITLYNLRNTVIKKQIELDKANLNLLNFKEKMWLKSEGM